MFLTLILVDLEGFPRNDLDLVAIRTARNKYVCTQNDHKSMMKKIEFAMTEYHQAVKESKISPKFSSQQPNESWKPFAIVGTVTVSFWTKNFNLHDVILAWITSFPCGIKRRRLDCPMWLAHMWKFPQSASNGSNSERKRESRNFNQCQTGRKFFKTLPRS